MKNRYRRRKRNKVSKRDIDYKFLTKDKEELVNSIEVFEEENIRLILDDALRYENMQSDDIVEYRERDLKTVMVNCIRHTKTTYETGLKSFYKSSKNASYTARKTGYILYKNATLNSISKTYPYLEDDCDRQKRKMNMIKIVSQ